MRSFLSTPYAAFLFWAAVLPAAVFPAQVTLSGKVTFADGSPMAGITVAVPTPQGQRETQTDVQGNYSFSIDEGSYDHLRVRNMGTELAGIPRMVEQVAVQPLVVSGNTVKNVAMPAFHRIHGTLRAPGGAAVANVQLNVQRWDGSMNQLPSDENTTDSGGAFELFCAGPQAKLTVPAGLDSGHAAFQLILALSKDTLLDLAYTRAPVLSGIVRTADGIPVPNITVAVVKDDRQHEKRTDGQGRYAFTLSAGSVGEIRIRAMGDTNSLVPAEMEHKASGTFVLGGDLAKDVTLPKYPLFSGRVLGAGSQPLAGFRLTVHAWSNGMRQPPRDNAVTDSAGRFALRCALGANQLVIEPASGAIYATVIQDFAIAGDSASDISLKKGAVLAGRVLLADSTPVEGVVVAISNGLEQKEARTDAQGRFLLLAQPGKYPDFRIRNMGHDLAGVPRMLEHAVQAGGITLGDSTQLTVVLPPFRRLSGKVKDPSLGAVSGVTISSALWMNGMKHLPNDESLTTAGGAYELWLAAGTNWITVLPPLGSSFALASFTVKAEDGDLAHDILLAEQAKGIASVQPSVVSQGKSGKLDIIGINTQFSHGVSGISLGEGITVTGIIAHSDISITAEVAVSADAEPGSRSMRVTGSKGTWVGSGVFMVTAPATADLDLDGSGKVRKAVVVEDGTGTLLKVDSGTTVKLPAGADASLGFEAPIIKNDKVNPAAAEFLQVQREFFPSGVVFDPPATLTFNYRDQDMKDVDESQLRAFKYDNKTDAVVGEYKVLERDTAKNLLKQEVPTFSLFRLARSMGGASVRPGVGRKGTLELTRLTAVQGPGHGQLRLNFQVQGAGAQAGGILRFRLMALDGRIVDELQLTAAGLAHQVVEWPLAGASRGAGCFKLMVEAGGRRLVVPIVLGL